MSKSTASTRVLAVILLASGTIIRHADALWKSGVDDNSYRDTLRVTKRFFTVYTLSGVKWVQFPHCAATVNPSL